MWAMYATPPVSSVPAMDPNPLTNCIRIHRPSITIAGTARDSARRHHAHAVLGKSSRYPPSMPLIAPEAPTVGRRSAR